MPSYLLLKIVCLMWHCKKTFRELNTSHYQYYSRLNADGRPSFLLDLPIPLHLLRTISQIRMLGFPITVDQNFTFLSHSSICKLCSLKDRPENLFHILVICPHYSKLRLTHKFINLVLPNDYFHFTNYFKHISTHNIFRFVKILTYFFKARTQGLSTLSILPIMCMIILYSFLLILVYLCFS